MDDWTDIGYTGKARGLRGEVRLKVKDNYMADVLAAEVLFLKMQGQPIPYFVEEVSEERMLIKFEGVDNREQAARIAGKVICTETRHLIPEEEKPQEEDPYALEYAECLGLLLVDETAGELGKIEEVVQYPQQEIALLQYQGKEIMVPLNPTFVKKVDIDKGRVLVDLPEGLLGL